MRTEKGVGKNQNTYFISNNFFPRNLALYEIKWKNVVRPGRPQMTIRQIRILRWVPKATNTKSEYVYYCSSTGKMVARTRPNIALYFLCLSR